MLYLNYEDLVLKIFYAFTKSFLAQFYLPFGCCQSLNKTGAQTNNVTMIVATMETSGRTANTDSCTSPDVDPPAIWKSGFNFCNIVANNLSRNE